MCHAVPGKWCIFGCMLSAGFDSVVNERANTLTYPKGKSRYTVALLLELLTIKPIKYKITLDGKRIDTGGMTVMWVLQQTGLPQSP